MAWLWPSLALFSSPLKTVPTPLTWRMVAEEKPASAIKKANVKTFPNLSLAGARDLGLCYPGNTGLQW